MKNKNYPPKLILKEEICWLPITTLLHRVKNPYEDLVWDGCLRPLDVQNIQKYLDEKDFEADIHDPALMYSIAWHERRVAKLVNDFRDIFSSNNGKDIASKIDPLDIELPILGLGYFPSQVMSDGFHRFSAAIFLGLHGCYCDFSGDLAEIREWIKESGELKFLREFDAQYNIRNNNDLAL